MPLTSSFNTRLSESVLWNLFLIASGSLLYAVGAQCVAAKHGFLTGGIYGTSLLLWYVAKVLDPPTWYVLLNLPLLALAWFRVGRHFLLYTAFGVAATSVCGELVNAWAIPVQNQLYAAVVGGVFCGAGGGIILRSMGSGGGMDVVAIMLRERWNISIGRFSFVFNALLFSAGATYLPLDTVVVSIIFVFISSSTLEQVMGMFNQRKTVFIISENGEAICEAIVQMERFGATLIRGKGGFLGTDREILLTVTNNIALKRLEHLVFSLDERALFIVENTFYVSGGQFARKKYK